MESPSAIGPIPSRASPGPRGGLALDPEEPTGTTDLTVLTDLTILTDLTDLVRSNGRQVGDGI